MLEANPQLLQKFSFKDKDPIEDQPNLRKCVRFRDGPDAGSGGVRPHPPIALLPLPASLAPLAGPSSQTRDVRPQKRGRGRFRDHEHGTKSELLRWSRS